MPEQILREIQNLKKSTFIVYGVIGGLMITAVIFFLTSIGHQKEWDKEKLNVLEGERKQLQLEREGLQKERLEIHEVSVRLDSSTKVLNKDIALFQDKLSTIKKETDAKVNVIRRATPSELDSYFSNLTEDYIR